MKFRISQFDRKPYVLRKHQISENYLLINQKQTSLLIQTRLGPHDLIE